MKAVQIIEDTVVDVPTSCDPCDFHFGSCF